MQNIKVSIVIPVYNGEQYIEKCINSLLNQTLQELEILVVNDGSIDNTTEIIDNFSKKDTRIRIISQEQKGASAARNAGITQAKGDYIGFVDIDDIIEADMFYKLYSKAIKYNHDIVCCSFYEEKPHQINEFKDSLFGNDYLKGDTIREIYFKYIIEDKHLGYLPLWNKIFRKNLLQNNNILLDETMVLGEDRVFCSQAILHASSIGNCNEILYHYLKYNNDSLTNGYNQKKIDYYLKDRESLRLFLEKNLSSNDMNQYLIKQNHRIFYKLLDFCFIEMKQKNSLFKKYYSIKDILLRDEFREIVSKDLNISFTLKLLVFFIRKEKYYMVLIMLYLKSMLKLERG